MISGQTLCVCPEGKPVSTFPDHPANGVPLILLIGFQSHDVEAEWCAIRNKTANSHLIEIHVDINTG
jgi:hypothetical protein